jgi:hypothetical protein
VDVNFLAELLRGRNDSAPDKRDCRPPAVPAYWAIEITEQFWHCRRSLWPTDRRSPPLDSRWWIRVGHRRWVFSAQLVHVSIFAEFSKSRLLLGVFSLDWFSVFFCRSSSFLLFPHSKGSVFPTRAVRRLFLDVPTQISADICGKLKATTHDKWITISMCPKPHHVSETTPCVRKIQWRAYE